MPELPVNWVSTTLGAFCDLVNGRAFKPSDWSSVGLPIIRIQNLRNPDAEFNRFAGQADDRHLVDDGDLLFAWSGTPGTSFRAHIWTGDRAVLNQHIFKIVFDDAVANAEFLRIAINASLPALRKQAKGGAGLKHLTRSAVAGIPIPLPPRPEQDRIVEALAETAGRLATVQVGLEVVSRTVPLIELQVLVRAARGTLSKASSERSARTHAARQDRINLPIQNVGEVQIGRQRSPDVHEGPSMRPYLRVANVLDDRIDTSDIMTMNFDGPEYERYRLVPGDILLNEGQSLDLVGRAAMFRGEIQNVCFTNTLIRFRAGPLVDPEYALLVFRAYQKTGKFRDIARITTNLAHLGVRRFAELQFPLFSLDRQREIVEIARGLITKIRETNLTLLALRSGADELISALQKLALSGRLSRRFDLEAAPTVALPKVAASPIPQEIELLPKIMTGERAKAMSKLNLVEALAQSGRSLDGQELFSAAGYPEDASVLEVERFFIELRSALSDGSIKRLDENLSRFTIQEPRG